MSASILDTESGNRSTSSSVVVHVSPKKATEIQSSALCDGDSPYSHELHDIGAISTPVNDQSPQHQVEARKNLTQSQFMAHRRDNSTPRNPRLTAVEKVLLLNAYPLLYIILWIPGLSNRLVEASGHSSTALQVLQSTTQFIGLANAFTFGWNERVAQQLKRKFRKK
jgi:hypothetical protein